MASKIRPLVATACLILMLGLSVALGVFSDPGGAVNVDWYPGWHAWAGLTVLAAGVAWATGAIRQPSASALATSLLFIPAYLTYIAAAAAAGNGSLLVEEEAGFMMPVASLVLISLASAAVAAVVGGLCGLVAHWTYSNLVWVAGQIRQPRRA